MAGTMHPAATDEPQSTTRTGGIPLGELKYRTLANDLRAGIQSGQYGAGQRLPSENELALTRGLSRQTVRLAMRLLEEEGLTERVRGSGTYVKQAPRRPVSHNIAVITTYISDYIFPMVLNGIEKTLASRQYTAMLASTQNQVDRERSILKEFLQKNIDGFIIEGTRTALPNPNIDLYARIRELGLPVVFINGVYPELTDAVAVLSDDFQGGLDACEYLIHKGHSNIAGIFKSDDAQGHRRYAGMASAMIRHDLLLRDDNVLWFTTLDQAMLMDALALEVVSGCSAVVCYNDQVAVRLIELLRNRKIRVPEDIAVISFDNSTLSEVAAVKITSLEYPKERLGRIAAEKLLNMLKGGRETSVFMPWAFVEKDST